MRARKEGKMGYIWRVRGGFADADMKLLKAAGLEPEEICEMGGDPNHLTDSERNWLLQIIKEKEARTVQQATEAEGVTLGLDNTTDIHAEILERLEKELAESKKKIGDQKPDEELLMLANGTIIKMPKDDARRYRKEERRKERGKDGFERVLNAIPTKRNLTEDVVYDNSSISSTDTEDEEGKDIDVQKEIQNDPVKKRIWEEARYNEELLNLTTEKFQEKYNLTNQQDTPLSVAETELMAGAFSQAYDEGSQKAPFDVSSILGPLKPADNEADSVHLDKGDIPTSMPTIWVNPNKDTEEAVREICRIFNLSRFNEDGIPIEMVFPPRKPRPVDTSTLGLFTQNKTIELPQNFDEIGLTPLPEEFGLSHNDTRYDLHANMSECVRRNDIVGVLEYYKFMLDKEEDIEEENRELRTSRTFNNLLRLYYNQHNDSKFEEIYREAIRHPLGADDHATHALKVYQMIRANKTENMMDVYEVMLSQRVAPDKFIYGRFIEYLLNEHDHHRALDVFEEMRIHDVCPTNNTLALMAHDIHLHNKTFLHRYFRAVSRFCLSSLRIERFMIQRLMESCQAFDFPEPYQIFYEFATGDTSAIMHRSAWAPKLPKIRIETKSVPGFDLGELE